ncbi:Isoleucyl-tRNA synthetase [Nesidiocoris tenuis]|uniref:Isoleucyl-tRNA synthetase n=1 Tax=Nesidiocoris tenuis TaxID=355587 RepID=A0ABN7BAL2_9HEMI|nr:Isoleucyl-tRNA synthetase [Nesidiocoris tenuis]
MSKSLGNVINPQDITRGGFDTNKDPPYGVDVLRWWVASHGLQHSTTTISKRLLDECAENIKRLRNTLKFLVGSIADFPPESVVEPPVPSTLDNYFLLQLLDFQAKVDQSYESFQLNRVCSSINNFVANDLSSFYCHITKDRLYCDGSRSERRKSTQYAMFHALNILTKSFAPIMPILAEELYSYHPHKTDESKPYFFEFDRIPPLQLKLDSREISQLKSCFVLALDLKKEVAAEIPVNLKSTEVGVVIRADSSSYELLRMLQIEDVSFYSDLVAILQVSHVRLEKDESACRYSVDVRVADYELCARCRKCCVPRASDSDVCSRCDDVLDLCPTLDVSSV